MRIIVLSLILGIVFSVSISRADSTEYITIGEVVFDCYHINFPWGYVLKGFYIDRNRNIYKYDRSGKPWMSESVRKGPPYPEADLMDKFATAQLVSNIDNKTLQEKIQMIPFAARGTISRRQTGNDMGGTGCVAYSFDINKKTYSEINLGFKGDFEEINSSREAKLLHNWLDGYLSLMKDSK